MGTWATPGLLKSHTPVGNTAFMRAFWASLNVAL